MGVSEKTEEKVWDSRLREEVGGRGFLTEILKVAFGIRLPSVSNETRCLYHGGHAACHDVVVITPLPSMTRPP